MRKTKTVLTLIVGILSTVILTACGCSPKAVNPTKISVDVTNKNMFVTNTVDVNYQISPANSSKQDVVVSVSNPEAVSVSETEVKGTTGKITITALKVTSEDVVVTYTIKNTQLSTSTIIKVYPDPVKLNTPISDKIVLSENKIVFKNVPNASAYLVNINGTDYRVTDPDAGAIYEHNVSLDVFNDEIFLAYDQGHSVKVKALGDGLQFADSDYSSEFKFIKLSKVTNLTANNGIVTWDANALSNRYDVYVNDELMPLTITDNTYAIINDEAKDYVVKVRASYNSVGNVNEQGYVVYAGEISDNYTITKMAKTIIELKNDIKLNGKTLNSFIKFSSVTGATSYKVNFVPALQDGTSEIIIDATDLLQIEVNENFAHNTSYQITVTPMGDPLTTIVSEPSTYNFRTGVQTSNFNILNNVLTFDAIEQASGYELILNSGTQEYCVTSTRPSFNLAENVTVSGAYDLSIRVLGLQTEVLNIANGLIKSTEKNITKLSNPVVNQVSNTGDVVFNVVTGANSYAVYLDDTYLDPNTTSAHYQLNFDALTAGAHTVKVVAIGNGESTISSGLNNAVIYEFTKLDVASNFMIENDIISFMGVTGAINYNVKFNDGNFTLNGAQSGTQTFIVNNDVKNGVNTVIVVSVGDNIKNISSNVVSYQFDRLEAPQNLRVENGILKWDTSENIIYKVFVGDDEEGVIASGGTFNLFTTVNSDMLVKVKAYPVAGGYISSEFANFTVNKLSKVNLQGIKTELISADNVNANYRLSWQAVANATSYNIIITDTLGNEFQSVYNTTDTFILIPEDFASDNYTIKIMAIGNTTNSSVGYINSEVETFMFNKLNVPTNLRVSNNQLVWSYSGVGTPGGYTVAVTYNGSEEFYNVTAIANFTFDLSKYGTDEISVKVRADGNNFNAVTGKYSDAVIVNRLNPVTGLSVKNGAITFDKPDTSLNYNIYVNGVKDENATVTVKDNIVLVIVPAIVSGTEYKIQIESYSQDYLTSAKTSELVVYKLPAVTGFNIANNIFSFNSVTNATAYEIADNNGQVKQTLTNSLDFSEFNYADQGIYSFKIRAIGSVNETSVGYLNSNFTTDLLKISLVPAPTASIINSKLIIVPNENIDFTPSKYRVEIYGPSTFSKTLENYELELDLSTISLDAGQYTINIYSEGNGANIIPLGIPFQLTRISKLDAANIELGIKEGVVTWAYQTNVKYDIYLDGEKVSEDYEETSIIFDNLNKGQEYIVQLVSKANGAIDSNKTKNLSVTKLPEVKNFKVISESGTYYFNWELLDGTTYADVTNFYFNVEAITPLSEFNGVTVNGGISKLELVFNYPNLYSADFNIRAMGSRQSTSKGYLNGDLMQSNLTVTKLQSITDLNKDENNLLIWTNPNANSLNIQLTFTNLDTNEIIERTLPASAVSYDVVANLEAGNYSLEIIAIGDVNNNILNSAVTNSQIIEILQKVTHVGSYNGYLTWQPTDQDVVYEIYADGVKLSRLVEILPDPPVDPPVDPEVPVDPENPEQPKAREGEDPTYETLYYFDTTESAKIINSVLSVNKNINITLVSIKLETHENTLTFNSESSIPFVTQKLTAVTDLKFENHLLKWSKAQNAVGYLIKAKNLEDETLTNADIFGVEHPDYNTELDGLYIAGNAVGVDGFKLPILSHGNYQFYVVAIGTSINPFELTEEPNSVVYLTGEKSNIVETIVLGTPLNIRMENGFIHWDSVPGAIKYKVEVTFGEKVNGATRVETTEISRTSIGLEQTEYFAGYYVVRIETIGDGKFAQNSGFTEEATILVYKPASPQNYKVRNGFISWEMPYSDKYMMALNGNAVYDEATKESIISVITGNMEDAILKQKYSFLTKVEATINGITYTNLKPYSIQNSSNGNNIEFMFDFNFTELKNPYEIKVRYLGNGFDGSTPVVINIDNGDGTTESIPIANYVNGVYTKVIKAYKLGAPQTPIVQGINGGQPILTMVKNDNLYFSKIAAQNGFVVNYLITAIPENNGQVKTKTISADSFLAKNDKGEVISNTIHCVPINAIGLNSGTIYNLNVRAVGTTDSDRLTTGESIYLTSYYNNSCNIVVLDSPQTNVTDGKVGFSDSYGAEYLRLRIWSASVQDFDKNKEKDGIVMFETFVTEESLADNPFLSRENNFYYNLTNNPTFAPGKYFFTVDGIGNGVTSISSSAGDKLSFFKTDGVQSVYLQEGKFNWESINYKDPTGITIKAKQYKINITRVEYKNEIATGNEEVTTIIVDADDVTTSAQTSPGKFLCVYDLPSNSNLYPAAKDDATFKYKAEIGLYGTEDSLSYDEETGEPNKNLYGKGIYVVSSDSAQSREYARLSAPSVRMEKGKLVWDRVSRAKTFEVYMLDKTEELVENYSLISDGKLWIFNFDGLNLESGQAYNIVVRALPGKDDLEFLNGEYSPELLVSKLNTPNLRIEDGYVKWNSTNLDVAVATAVNLKITGPQGFKEVNRSTENDTAIDPSSGPVDITDIINGPGGYPLVGNDANFPAGEYTFSVQFVGSNGPITWPLPTEPETFGDEGGEGGNTGSEIPPGIYCWFSSNVITMKVTKLQTIEAARYISDDGTKDYVRIKTIPNGQKYTFTVLKYDENHNVIKSFTTKPHDINVSGDYIEKIVIGSDTYLQFDTTAVTKNDEANAGDAILFGTEYSIYAQSFNFDASPTDEKRFVISNPSNIIAIEKVKKPTNIREDGAVPGLIRWTNATTNTFTRIYVETSIDGGITINETFDIQEYNVQEFMLKTIGNATVEIQSYILTGNGELVSDIERYNKTINYSIYSSGDGRESNPYKITSETELDNIKYNMGSYFELSNDINIAPVSNPQELNFYDDGIVVGSDNQVFTGIIDGKGYSIRNLTYTGLKNELIAFIYKLDVVRNNKNEIIRTGTIKNLNLNISGTVLPVTEFAGLAYENNGLIENVTINGAIGYNTNSSEQHIAGVTVTNYGTINRVVNNVNYTTGDKNNMKPFVSGVAYENKGVIKYSGNNGLLIGSNVAGVVNINGKTVDRCYNTGNFTSIAYIAATVGGIIGYNDSTATSITNCYNLIGNINLTSKNSGARITYGGILGNNSTSKSIENSYVAVLSTSVISNSGNVVFKLILGNYGGTGTQIVYNNFYIIENGGAYEVDSLATKLNNKEALISTFTSSNPTLSAIYQVDVNGVINKGYPYFK